MFSLSHEEPLSAETRSASPATHAHLWAVRAATVALAIGVAAGTVLVGSHVAFAQTPIGGTAGLFALYAATMAVGVGLAILFQLVAFANRLAATLTTLTPPPAKVISLPPRAPQASEPELHSRPFNAA
jgi:hypothetical protein